MQLLLFETVINMKADILFCLSKQLSHLLLGQPDGVILKPYFNLSFLVLGLVYDYFVHQIRFTYAKIRLQI
jgi:hypothetical protein